MNKVVTLGFTQNTKGLTTCCRFNKRRINVRAEMNKTETKQSLLGSQNSLWPPDAPASTLEGCSILSGSFHWSLAIFCFKVSKDSSSQAYFLQLCPTTSSRFHSLPTAWPTDNRLNRTCMGHVPFTTTNRGDPFSVVKIIKCCGIFDHNVNLETVLFTVSSCDVA